MTPVFQSERDSIAFLGLLSIAYVNFDFQFKHPDGEFTHANGLNIFAAIIDNRDGELIGQQRNCIHSQNNPMLHAEQLTLKQAIERINAKRPRVTSTTSMENYYRKLLFNDPLTGDYLHVGATIYTTLEPCPFCSSALLVNRMKRIVYLIPDKVYGSAFNKLKTDYYPRYDMLYEVLTIPQEDSDLIRFAGALLQKVRVRVDELKTVNPSLPDTLLLDYMSDLLAEARLFLLSLDEKALVTDGTEKATNLLTLTQFKEKIQ